MWLAVLPTLAAALSTRRLALEPRLAAAEVAHSALLARLGVAPEAPVRARENRRVALPRVVHEHGDEGDSFFSKALRMTSCGLTICAHADVLDGALLVAHDRVSRMVRSMPKSVLERLSEQHVTIQIIGRRQQVSELPEHRALFGVRGLYANEVDARRVVRHGVWAELDEECARGYRLPLIGVENQTVDERTRGLGGLNASVGEENLLTPDDDPRYAGRDILTHEFAHTLMDYGLPPRLRDEIEAGFARSVGERGLWRKPTGVMAYAGTCAAEWWAELSMWYWGSHGEYVDSARRLPAAGPGGLAAYDPDGFALVGGVYSGTHPLLAAPNS